MSKRELREKSYRKKEKEKQDAMALEQDDKVILMENLMP